MVSIHGAELKRGFPVFEGGDVAQFFAFVGRILQ